MDAVIDEDHSLREVLAFPKYGLAAWELLDHAQILLFRIWCHLILCPPP